MTPRKTLFIINPAAGGGRAGASWPGFRAQLEREGVAGNQLFTSRPGEAVSLARTSAHSHDLVVAVGGDGTVFEVVSGLLAQGDATAALGIVPFGTGNDSAAALGVGTCTAAVDALVRESTKVVDAIRIECQADGSRLLRHALLFAGVGIVGETLKRTTRTVKRMFGQRLAYRVGLFHALLTYRSPRMKVACNGEAIEDSFLFVCASNTERAGGGMKIAPGAVMDDGRLDLNLVRQVGRWEALGQLRRLSRGTHIHHPKVRFLAAPSLSIDAQPDIEVAADGEIVGMTPARFEICPKALRVLGK